MPTMKCTLKIKLWLRIKISLSQGTVSNESLAVRKNLINPRKIKYCLLLKT
jgi:hypothetical protein